MLFGTLSDIRNRLEGFQRRDLQRCDVRIWSTAEARCRTIAVNADGRQLIPVGRAGVSPSPSAE